MTRDYTHEALIEAGSTKIRHPVLIAEISDDVILGLKAQNEPRILMSRTKSVTSVVRIVIAYEDVTAPANSALNIKVACDGLRKHQYSTRQSAYSTK